MSGDLSALRRDYASRALTEEDAFTDAIAQFSAWWTEAVDSQLLDVNAMTLATASRAGEPSARIVLLKGFGPDGFVFFTNYESAKAHQLEENPRASLLLLLRTGPRWSCIVQPFSAFNCPTKSMILLANWSCSCALAACPARALAKMRSASASLTKLEWQ